MASSFTTLREKGITVSLSKRYLSFPVMLVLLFLHSNSYCQKRDAIDGPIRSRNQYPPFMLCMDLYPDGAETIPKGHVKCSLDMLIWHKSCRDLLLSSQRRVPPISYIRTFSLPQDILRPSVSNGVDIPHGCMLKT